MTNSTYHNNTVMCLRLSHVFLHIPTRFHDFPFDPTFPRFHMRSCVFPHFPTCPHVFPFILACSCSFPNVPICSIYHIWNKYHIPYTFSHLLPHFSIRSYVFWFVPACSYLFTDFPISFHILCSYSLSHVPMHSHVFPFAPMCFCPPTEPSSRPTERAA